MIVYIDVLIILNLYVTYFILKAAARLTHSDYKLWRLIAAAVFGGIGSLLSLTSAGFAVSLILKLLLIAMSTAIAFGLEGGFIVKALLCAVISMLLCGLIELLREALGTDFMFSVGGSVYMNISALILVAATALAYGVITIIRRRLDSPRSDMTVTLDIENNGRRVSVTALPDSGNTLCDFLSGTPVIVCRADAIEAVIPDNLAAWLRGSDSDTGDMSGLRLLPIRTASGTGLIAAFRPDSLTARYGDKSKSLNALIGTGREALIGEKIDAVINPKLL